MNSGHCPIVLITPTTDEITGNYQGITSRLSHCNTHTIDTIENQDGGYAPATYEVSIKKQADTLEKFGSLSMKLKIWELKTNHP